MTADYMQYTKESELTYEQEDALSGYGQFYSCTDDFKFLARLRSAKATQKEIEDWFSKNEKRQVFYIAQGILASVYGQDPHEAISTHHFRRSAPSDN